MVVVSGNRTKNVASFSLPAMVMSDESKVVSSTGAKAILICRPLSHPFQERTLSLEQPVKVGRSVARARAAATNAIFDCKVLSRHHALLWYDNGKFYLQDTKSSNGTFVNNTRLPVEAENHEVRSGDIVQFGVDVIENNRKVTHGCIIATLKLYLPDGKEAKSSPSIAENSTHAVPLDELYKLHQIIQEATHREQCLETKLSALQNVVDEARKSAEESWQLCIGEERLLSRISALETQLQQATKNYAAEEQFRDEINRIQEHNVAYQIAAKEALEKLHSERLQALATATEQERCRISAEQETLLVKEQLMQVQQELEEVAMKLTEIEQKAYDEKNQLEHQKWDLQARLDEEVKTVERLLVKLKPFAGCKNILDFKPFVYDEFDDDDLKAKEELVAENETEMNKANGDDSGNHVNSLLEDSTVSDEKNDTTAKEETEELINSREKAQEKRVTFDVSSDLGDIDGDEIDSKTLKYKYQSATNELKRKIEILETILEANSNKMAELQKDLTEEYQRNCENSEENKTMKEALSDLQTKFKESCNENQQLKDKIGCLVNELEVKQDQNVNNISNSSVSFEQLVSLEEELVLLKERYAQINNDKLKLQNDYDSLKIEYNKMCNSSYDRMYFYIAPLILMILYLVISAMIS